MPAGRVTVEEAQQQGENKHIRQQAEKKLRKQRESDKSLSQGL
jgi:hypothetical protein